MDRTVTLAVGESFQLRKGKDHITYAGMVTGKTFSLVQRKRKFVVPYAACGFAWNLFYPREQTHLTIDEVRIEVDNVTPEEIRLRV